jgi:hypothetical protein
MNKNIVSLVLLNVIFFTFGCSKNSSPQFDTEYSFRNNRAAGFTYSESMEKDYFNEEPISVVSADLTNLNNIERKLVKKANIRIRVENLEMADASVSELVRKYGAYAASTETEENSRRYSIRVPSPQYDNFLGETGGMGRMLRRAETTEDVTLNYYDLEGRLATKKELLKTYQTYLGKANNIEEILSVETRIADLQNDIDWTGTQLRNLANTVDYATVDLNLLGPAASTSNQKTTFIEQVKILFNSFGTFLSIVGVVIIGIVIYVIPVLLLLIFFYLILFGRIGLLKKLWRIITSQNKAIN